MADTAGRAKLEHKRAFTHAKFLRLYLSFVSAKWSIEKSIRKKRQFENYRAVAREMLMSSGKRVIPSVYSRCSGLN